MTNDPKERVTGMGGVFFKARDAARLREWYRDHLGIEVGPDGSYMFRWRDDQRADVPEVSGSTVWSILEDGSDSFDPSTSRFMLNYRVANLHRMLTQLREAGVPVDDRVEEGEYGRFGWAMDPEGNRFELWEPPPGY